MERKIIIGVLILLLLFPCTGCSIFAEEEPEDITIYTLYMENFFDFLREDSRQYLNENCRYYNICQPEMHFNTACGDVFYISTDFFDFMNSAKTLENYLAENEIREKVVDAAILDVYYIPLSTWIKTEKNTYFITIEDGTTEYSDDYTYHLYTQSEYLEKFDNGGSPRLSVNGELVSAISRARIDWDHVDIPLESVLLGLGATFRKIDNDSMNIEVTFLGNIYIFNKHDMELIDESGADLLLWFGHEEAFCVYRDGRNAKVYVDNYTLENTLDSMGMPVDVTYDPITHVLDISPQTP